MSRLEVGIADEYGTIRSGDKIVGDCVVDGENEIALIEVDREHLVAILDADRPFHVVELRDDGWSIEHPIGCRAHGLLNCELHQKWTVVAPSFRHPLGRYQLLLDDEGVPMVGEEVGS